jgi:hypothetical protein
MLLIVAAAVHTSAAAASVTQEAILEDDNQLLGNPIGALATVRFLGVTRVRVNLKWYTVAPHSSSRRPPRHFRAGNPASYPTRSWAPYDTLVRKAGKAGIAVMFTISGPAPAWATGAGAPRNGPSGVWKPSPSDYGAFVRAVGTRYSGHYRPGGRGRPLPRVSLWSVWNEANFGIDLAPQAIAGGTIEVGAARYRQLLDAAWSALHASGHGADTILIAETAPRGVAVPGDSSGVKPLRFLRALYCVDSRYRELRGTAASERGCPTTAAGSRSFRSKHPALFDASGFADHPYAQGVAPNVPTYACGSQVCSNPKTHRSDPDYADLAEIPRLERTLDRLNRVYGSLAQFPIYSTEYGYWTKPPDAAAKITPATAAYYINWAEYLSWRQRRLRSYDQYLLLDSPTKHFASGLEFPDGTHKVTFSAFRLPLFLPHTSFSHGSRVEVWGCVRPAHFALLDTGRGQRVEIQFRRGSGGRFKRINTAPISNPRGYFDVRVAIPAGGAVRLSWVYPTGQRIFSRTVKVSSR